MGPRTRKAIGGVAMLVFLLAYVSIAGLLGSMLPNQWALKLVYYALAGLLWGVPLLPLIRWMNRA